MLRGDKGKEILVEAVLKRAAEAGRMAQRWRLEPGFFCVFVLCGNLIHFTHLFAYSFVPVYFFK